MVHLRHRVERAWPDGIILVCKLSSGREASDTVRSRESQVAGAGRIYTTSSWLKGRDSFTTPGVLHSSIPFQYTCSSRPPSMIQGTGLAQSRVSPGINLRTNQCHPERSEGSRPNVIDASLHSA